MGLAASQARLLLLTAKNNAYELRAQMLEEERLLLAQEQETIANEYSEATTNTIYEVLNSDGSKENLTLETLANNMGSFVILDSSGNVLCTVASSMDPATTGSLAESNEITYYKANGSSTFSSSSSFITQLNDGSTLESLLKSGVLTIAVQVTDVGEENNCITVDCDGLSGCSTFVRKSLDSLDCVSSRYYTEDDAAAKAEYDAAMTRVSTMDTRLENQLNQVETKKKAVEQEMESVSSLIDSNIERTFQYFS